MSFNEKPQYPLNGLGQRMQEASVGVHKLIFAGQGTPAPGTFSGVGTAYGIPGMSVPTRAATGCYDVTFPPSTDVVIFPSIQQPSGVAGFQAHIENRFGYAANVPNVASGASGVGLYVAAQGASGTARLVITQQQISGATILNTPVNPPTGLIVNLLCFVSPVRAF